MQSLERSKICERSNYMDGHAIFQVSEGLVSMRLIKELVKKVLYRPIGVSFGERSFMLRPFNVNGRKQIRIGSRSSVLNDSHLEAIKEYAGITYTSSIEIGDDVYIGRHAYFTAVNRIVIGDGCVLSDYVYITDEFHGMDPEGEPIMKQPLQSKGPVIIGPRCFLGFRVAIMPGVTLGEGCVVGTNSTVTRSFPPYSMIAGSPARLVKTYSHAEKQWLNASTFPDT